MFGQSSSTAVESMPANRSFLYFSTGRLVSPEGWVRTCQWWRHGRAQAAPGWRSSLSSAWGRSPPSSVRSPGSRPYWRKPTDLTASINLGFREENNSYPVYQLCRWVLSRLDSQNYQNQRGLLKVFCWIEAVLDYFQTGEIFSQDFRRFPAVE